MILFAVVGLTESLAFGHLSAFTPLFLSELHVPPQAVPYWTGILSAMAFVIGLPLLPFWGVWADKYGRKLIILRSSVFAAIIYALSAASRDVYMLALARMLGGFVLGNTGVMLAVQADITPRKRLGTSIAIISAGSPVGVAIGPYFGGLIVREMGIRTLLYLDALLTLLVVIALIVMLHEEPRVAVPNRSTRTGVLEALRAIAQTPPVTILFLVVFLGAFGMNMAQPFVPILIERLYLGPKQDIAPTIGAVLTLWGITMAVTTPFWGRLGDRVGYLQMVRLGLFAVSVTLIGQAMAGFVWQVGVWRAGQGMFQGGLGALAMVLLTLYTPHDRRSSVLVLSLLPQQLSWFLGPMAGSLLSKIGLLAPFWAGAAAIMAGWVLSFRLPVSDAGEGTPAARGESEAEISEHTRS